MKVIIIEDEMLVAEDLARTLLKINPAIEIVAILASVQQAVSYFKTKSAPDLVFSDIKLGDGLSFTIFQQILVDAPVIFCTAFDEYALEAFKTNGIEYILKPFSRDAVKQALGKFNSLKKQFSGTIAEQYEAAMEAVSSSGDRPRETLIIRFRDKLLPVNLGDIALFYVENFTVYAHLFSQKVYVIPESLEELEKSCGSHFFRINRQQLVNRSAIKDASTYLSRKLKVELTLPLDREIFVSKLRKGKFIDWLKF